jgi:hypothetical protein
MIGLESDEVSLFFLQKMTSTERILLQFSFWDPDLQAWTAKVSTHNTLEVGLVGAIKTHNMDEIFNSDTILDNLPLEDVAAINAVYPLKCCCGKSLQPFNHRSSRFLHVQPGFLDTIDMINQYDTNVCQDPTCHQRSVEVHQALNKREKQEHQKKIKMRICAHCRKLEVKMNKCGACELAHYCSAKCQRADWSQHEKNCTFVKAKK